MTEEDGLPKPELDKLLKAEQLAQVRCLLAHLAGRGFGRLEIVIEHNRLRRMVPHRFIPYPGSQVRYYPSSLPDDILGPWGVEVAGGLAEVMASGFGSVTILVEHARIAGIDVAPSVSSVP